MRYSKRADKTVHRGGECLRIALVHDSLNPCGGAERLALAMAKALKELGHSVDLYVIEATDWYRVEKLTSYRRQVIDREYVLPPFKSLPTIYSRLVHWFGRDVIGYHVIKRHSYDLVIATKQILIPVFADVLYMHFPDFLPGFDYLYYPDRYLYNTALRIYSRPLELISKLLKSLFEISEYKPLILTNSRFTALIIEKFLKIKPIVLYPPVSVEEYLPLSQNTDRKDIAVTISRIEPMKNLDLVLEIAKNVKEVRFVIIGSASLNEYYLRLLRKIEAFKLKDQVKILVGVSEETKKEVLRKAKIYLHPTRYEHFGISLVEAMAAGLVPVVHKSGGSWIDIVERGNYGFGFENEHEAVGHISYLVRLGKEELKRLQLRCVTKALTYSYFKFRDRLTKLLALYVMMRRS